MQINFFSGRNAEINLLDPTEVEANRRGELTTAQQARLNQMAWGGLGGGLIGAFVIGVMLCVFGSTFPLTGEWIFLVFFLFLFAVIGIPIVIGLWNAAQNMLRLQKDKTAGMTIRQATGEVDFDRKRRYFIRAGDRDLSLPASKNIGGLLPGLRYTFFYLEESGFVLSAEQLGTMSEPAVKSALQTVLMQANRFSDEDLLANRQGEITSAQRTRTLTGALGMLFLILIPAFVFGGMMISLFSGGELGDSLIPLIFVGGFALIFAAIGLYSLTRTALDVMEGVPQVLKGTGRKHSEVRRSGKSSRTYYYYIVGSTRFEVNQEAYTAFIDDLEYNVYFLPRTKKMLSLEPIDVPDDY